MNTPPVPSYETWLMRLQNFAAGRDLGWMISTGAGAHRAAYDSGVSPDDELIALADMAEWRGCGCGGGS